MVSPVARDAPAPEHQDYRDLDVHHHPGGDAGGLRAGQDGFPREAARGRTGGHTGCSTAVGGRDSFCSPSDGSGWWEILDAFGVTISFTTAAVVMADLRSRPLLRTSGFYRVRWGETRRGRSRDGGRGRPDIRLHQGHRAPGVPGPGRRRGHGLGAGPGEFRGTVIFAGSFRGITQTIPLAIFAEFQSDIDAAVAFSVLVLGFAFVVILAVRYLTARSTNTRNRSQATCA